MQLTSMVGCEVRAATSASGTTAACHSCNSCSWPEHAGAELAMALQSSKLLCSCQPALLTLCGGLGCWLVDASQAGSQGRARAGGGALPLALRASTGLGGRLAGASLAGTRRGLADTASCGAQPDRTGATLVGAALAPDMLQCRLGCLVVGSGCLGAGSRWAGHARSLAGDALLLLQVLGRWRWGNTPWHRLLHRDSCACCSGACRAKSAAYTDTKSKLNRNKSRVCWLQQAAACLGLNECKAGGADGLQGYGPAGPVPEVRTPCTLQKWSNTLSQSPLTPNSV